MTNALAPIVTLKGNRAFANSRDVAEFFGKAHNHVLRDIDLLISDAPSIASSFGLIGVEVKVGFGVRMDRAFDMTKDGFTLLAMGFTGGKALQFKLAYIAAFNSLEAKVTRLVPALPNFSNPVLAARAWANQLEQKQVLQIENQRLVPLAAIGARAVAHDHTLNCFVRTFPGVNTMLIKRDLTLHKYLRKAGAHYRVYARFAHLFTERLDGTYGNVAIFPTAAGRALLIEMYEAGRLTMKKGYAVAAQAITPHLSNTQRPTRRTRVMPRLTVC